MATASPFKALNHFVSRLQLRQFSQDGHTVFEYPLVVEHAKCPLFRQTALKVLARQSHLYTGISPDGPSDDLERWFDKAFEAPATESLSRAVGDQPMKPSDWSALIRLFALQDQRTPAQYILSRERWTRELPHLIADLEHRFAAGGIAISPADLRKLESVFDEMGVSLKIKLLASPENKVKLLFHTAVGRKAWLADIRNALRPSGPLRGLLSHRWTILKAPPGGKFITCDRPAVKIVERGYRNWHFGAGWGEPGAVLFMPLGPQHLLYTQLGHEQPSRGTELSAEKLSHVNSTIANNAFRAVYCFTPDRNVLFHRPRKVSGEQVRAERSDWKRWHAEQSAAERHGSPSDEY